MEPVHWIKAKYAAPKTKGKFKSSHNDNTRYRRHHKTGSTQSNTTVLVIGPTGKRRFEHD